jgi:signal transduction histidine kinase
MDGTMTRVSSRCLAAVLMPLALDAAVLWLLSALRGAGTEATWVLGLLCVLACAALATTLLLRPLRSDLQLITALATGDEHLVRGAARPRTAECSGLLDGVALVRARSIELEGAQASARRAVEEAERLRVSFVAAMGHDLRGPLNGITGFSDLLVMEGHDAVGPAQRPSVEIIRRSAQDLLVLLDQILDWARLAAGQITLEPTTVRLQDVIADAVRDAVARSADRGLRVELHVDKAVPALQVDRARLAQALLGLMDHGTRASDQPRLTLSARLVVADDQRPRAVRIELHDPQLCVREADQSGFFEAFRPSYAPSGRRVAGLGLGPALARALIRAHGGQVWFTSRTDTGTTFTVELPLAMGMGSALSAATGA